MKDSFNPVVDGNLARFLLNSYVKDNRNEFLLKEYKMSIELFAKYISYAKHHFKPKINSSEDEQISKVYAKLRKESLVHAGIPIAFRHLESLIRIIEAIA